jgi:hypothetical protein
MDVSKYMAKGFIKPDDVRSGPRQERIVNVYPSERYDCLVLDLESGDQLSLNPITTRVLGKAHGTESNHWRGQVIELSCGTYKNKDGEEKETVLVKPISLPKHVGANSKSPTLADNETARAAMPTPTSIDLNDEIPF